MLVLERDLGTSLLFFGILLVMLYVATERVSWLLIGLAFFVGGCVRSPTSCSATSACAWRSGWTRSPTSTARGFQIGQALFGLGTGGVVGTGLGAGRPDLVPFAETDFMLSALGEELGLIGLAAILVVYLVLITRGLRSALAVRDSFGKLLAGGLAFALALQMFIVVGGVTKLIPLTGLTLPFLSYGGSSLLANYVLVALLLRISDAARAPLPRRPAQPAGPRSRRPSTELVERPTMNTPVRRVAIAVMVMILLLHGQPHVRPGGQGRRLPQRPAQPARAARRVLPPARPDQRRTGRCWRAASPPTTGCATSGSTPTGRCTRRSPATTR